tara:strand:+ start:169 stop:669 length:501 start_codon:yes stop_codon:yes gene_type:complete
MKNHYLLFILSFLLISCSENEEAKPDSVKIYLLSNIFKEVGSYSMLTNNTFLELTSTNFIDFKINSNQFNIHYSYHDSLDPDNANCYIDKSISSGYSILVDNENTFTIQLDSPIRILQYSYDSGDNVKLKITGDSGLGGNSSFEEILEVTNQQEFDTFIVRAPNEC